MLFKDPQGRLWPHNNFGEAGEQFFPLPSHLPISEEGNAAEIARRWNSYPALLAACVVDDAIQRLGLTVEACEEIESHGIVIEPSARAIRNIALGKWATAFRRAALATAKGGA